MENNKKVVPFGTFILVQYQKKGETDSGIVIPESVDEGDQGFLVIDTGADVELIHEGDYILFDLKKCIAVKVDRVDPDQYLVKEEDVIGLLQDKAVV